MSDKKQPAQGSIDADGMPPLPQGFYQCDFGLFSCDEVAPEQSVRDRIDRIINNADEARSYEEMIHAIRALIRKETV